VALEREKNLPADGVREGGLHCNLRGLFLTGAGQGSGEKMLLVGPTNGRHEVSGGSRKRGKRG